MVLESLPSFEREGVKFEKKRRKGFYNDKKKRTNLFIRRA